MSKHIQSPDPILNNDLLEQYRQRKSGLLARLIEAFLKEGQALFQSVRINVEKQDLKLVRMNAHTLKSASHNLGAVRLSAVCQEIEDAAINGETSAVEQLLAKLGPEFFEAEQALRGELAREQGILPSSSSS